MSVSFFMSLIDSSLIIILRNRLHFAGITTNISIRELYVDHHFFINLINSRNIYASCYSRQSIYDGVLCDKNINIFRRQLHWQNYTYQIESFVTKKQIFQTKYLLWKNRIKVIKVIQKYKINSKSTLYYGSNIIHILYSIVF